MSAGHEASNPIEQAFARKFSRRDLFKGAAGIALGAAAAHAFGEPQTAEARLDGTDEESTLLFSSDFLEHMALPVNEQGAIAQANFDRLMELRSKTIAAIGEELHGKLYADYPNTNPPRVTRDIDLAIQGVEPYYQIGDATDPNIPFTSIGLLQEIGQSVNRPEVAFSSMADSLLMGITNHKFASEVGPIDIQIAHLAGFYGTERKGRWMMPAYLGYSSEDPTVYLPFRTWIEGAKEEDDTIPFNPDPPKVEYKPTVNRLFDTVGQSVASFRIGLDYEIDAFDQASIAREMNAPSELFTNEFFHRNDEFNRRAYDWLQHKALYAAANSKTQNTALWSYPSFDSPTPANILGVFPEASDKNAGPDLPKSSDFFDKEELTLDDLAGIPSVYLARIKVAKEPFL